MRIKIQQFLFGALHSWAIVGKELARALIRAGNDVDLISTDGINPKYLPDDLAPFIVNSPRSSYDLCLSYTAPPNWEAYTKGGKTKMVIWCYEYMGNPLTGFAQYSKHVDWICPPSTFAADVLIHAGFPKEKIKILPHGVGTIPLTQEQLSAALERRYGKAEI